MNPVWIAQVAAGLAAGSALGAAYFAGLWWTARRLARSPRPRAIAGASFVARAALLAGALAGLSAIGPAALLAALAGFHAARVAAIRIALRSGRNA
ncbi:MAG: hypothetical protein JXP34_14875 [Planctomycetes bacterium]|nr:hypothetical protein [Planctomycetota bacterium]